MVALADDSGLLEQTTDLIHLARKFRWMGMEDEAMRVETALARYLALHDRSFLARRRRGNGIQQAPASIPAMA